MTNTMDDTLLYNSRIINTYVEYLKKYHPDVDIDFILKKSGITSYEVNDEGCWFTQRQVDEFYDALIKKTGDTSIAREAGRYIASSRTSNILRQYVTGFLSPRVAYWMVKKIGTTMSRAYTITTKTVSRDKVEVVFKPKVGVNEKPYQCENRIGLLESIATVFTNKPGKIDHPTCLHRGGDCCRYIVVMEKSPSFVWKQIGNYFTLCGFLACATLFFVLPIVSWIILTLSFAVSSIGILLYAERAERNELLRNVETQGNAADQLISQTNRRYNEALLIREIGQASSSILDIDKLLKFAVESLEKRLDFNRGMIMLPDKERTQLVYTVGYGYNQAQENFLIKTVFSLNKPHSRGQFVLAFKEQTPFLINDIEEIEKNISEKSLNFAKKMGVESFICVPIVYEGQSEGILAVDNLRSKRVLTQSDISLLIGITTQLGISINNARAYQMVKESEERFRALGENAPDIIYTLNTSGLFTYVNPACETILGHRKEEVIGRSFIDFINSEAVENLISSPENIRNNHDAIKNITTKILSKDGSERLFTMSCSSNLDASGEVAGLVGTLKDISELKRNFDKLQKAMQGTISAMSTIVDTRDPYTAGHQRRVADLACAIAEEMNFPEDSIEGIRMASLIHDVGKINIPVEILSKPGELNKFEFNIIKTHPEVGYNILKKVEFTYPVAQTVYEHHERMDGSGYPRGISGDEIFIGARIIAVADVVEAMGSHRPYRPSRGIDKALEEVLRHRGVYYDPEVVDACLRLFKEKGFKFNHDQEETDEDIYF